MRKYPDQNDNKTNKRRSIGNSTRESRGRCENDETHKTNVNIQNI